MPRIAVDRFGHKIEAGSFVVIGRNSYGIPKSSTAEVLAISDGRIRIRYYRGPDMAVRVIDPALAVVALALG